MQAILALMVMVIAAMPVVGCASKYSESSYQDKQALEDYLRENPDFYWKMKTEQP